MFANKMLRRAPLFLIALLFSVIPSGYSSSQTAASIRVAQANGRTVDVEFSEEELRKVQEDSRFVLQKLQENGVDCCGPREKLGDCVWRCCDGTQVRTCDAILTKALNELSNSNIVV